jgi:hypothetical protein
VGGVKRQRLDDVADVPGHVAVEAGEQTDGPLTPGWEVPNRRGHRSQKAVVGTGGEHMGGK